MAGSRLTDEENNDLELAEFFRCAVSEVDIDNRQRCFYLKSGILMRKFRPVDPPANHDWRITHQVVVPKVLRGTILSLVHDGGGRTFRSKENLTKDISTLFLDQG